MGILGGRDPAISIQSFKNRTNPKVHKAFSLLLGRDDLLVTLDRYGVMR